MYLKLGNLCLKLAKSETEERGGGLVRRTCKSSDHRLNWTAECTTPRSLLINHLGQETIECSKSPKHQTYLMPYRCQFIESPQDGDFADNDRIALSKPFHVMISLPYLTSTTLAAEPQPPCQDRRPVPQRLSDRGS